MSTHTCTLKVKQIHGNLYNNIHSQAILCYTCCYGSHSKQNKCDLT